jgi:hypothetical protein
LNYDNTSIIFYDTTNIAFPKSSPKKKIRPARRDLNRKLQASPSDDDAPIFNSINNFSNKKLKVQCLDKNPTGKPSGQPSGQPTGQPSKQPSRKPTGQPSGKPTGKPSRKPTGQPTISIFSIVTNKPSSINERLYLISVSIELSGLTLVNVTDSLKLILREGGAKTMNVPIDNVSEPTFSSTQNIRRGRKLLARLKASFTIIYSGISETSVKIIAEKKFQSSYSTFVAQYAKQNGISVPNVQYNTLTVSEYVPPTTNPTVQPGLVEEKTSNKLILMSVFSILGGITLLSGILGLFWQYKRYLQLKEKFDTINIKITQLQ